LVIDTTSGDITDIGVQDTAPDLSQFGPATAVSP
jgi:hypothetical protein